MLVVLNLLAFAFHTVCDLAERAWQKARQTVSSRRQFFETMQAMTAYIVFSSWQDLIETLAFERSPPSRRNTGWRRPRPPVIPLAKRCDEPTAHDESQN